MGFSLDGRTALVTGSVRGLGLEIARGMAEAGARVVLNGRDAVALDHSVAGLRAGGLDVDARAFDVTDLDAAGAAVAALGGVDVLVNRRRRRNDDDVLISDVLIRDVLISAPPRSRRAPAPPSWPRGCRSR